MDKKNASIKDIEVAVGAVSIAFKQMAIGNDTLIESREHNTSFWT